MLTPDNIRARVATSTATQPWLGGRSRTLEGAESPLLDAERKAYLRCIQGGIARFDDAWHVLTTAVAQDGEGRGGSEGRMGKESDRSGAVTTCSNTRRPCGDQFSARPSFWSAPTLYGYFPRLRVFGRDVRPRSRSWRLSRSRS